MVAKLNANEQKRNTYRKLWKGVEIKTLDHMFKNIIEQYDIFYDGVVENRAEAGKKGGETGSPKKQVTITDKMKQKNLDKYNLKVGQQFESCSALAEYCNVSSQTVSGWFKKGYIL